MLSVTRLSRLSKSINFRNIAGTFSTPNIRTITGGSHNSVNHICCKCSQQNQNQLHNQSPNQNSNQFQQPYNSYEAPSLTSGIIKDVEDGFVFTVKLIGGMIYMFIIFGICLAIVTYFIK